MRAVIAISKNVPGEPLYIRDVGPWDRFPTVTNDAEAVVDYLRAHNLVWQGRRLIYCDSDGHWDEILLKDGSFSGFRTLVQDEGEGGP